MSQDTQQQPWWRSDEVLYSSLGIVAGAFAGVACMLIDWGVWEAYRYAEIPEMTLLPPERRWEFWVFVKDAALGRLIVGSIVGTGFGLTTSCFSRASRHPASVAAMWGSIGASVGLALSFTLSNVQVPDMLACAVIFGGTGIVFGFVLGASARGVQAWTFGCTEGATTGQPRAERRGD